MRKAITRRGRSCLRVPFVGGNWNNGSNCGPRYVNWNNAPSNANWNYGARLLLSIRIRNPFDLLFAVHGNAMCAVY